MPPEATRKPVEVRTAGRMQKQPEIRWRGYGSIVTSGLWQLPARWILRVACGPLSFKPERSAVLAQTSGPSRIDTFRHIQFFLHIAIADRDVKKKLDMT